MSGRKGSATAEEPSPSAGTFVVRPTLLPPKWQRFQSQLEGREYDLPISGANVTLDDLIRAREATLAASKDDDVEDTDIDAPYGPDSQVGGWIGVPDPTKYAPGTTYLNSEELREEIEKGNVVASTDWRKSFAALQPWQQEILKQTVLEDYIDERVLFEFKPGEVNAEGGRVSYLDLKRYVDENPELAALAKKTMNIREGSEQGPPLGGADVGSLVIPANDEEMQRLSPAQRRQLQWVNVGTGHIYKRKPIRWLKGLGGVLDYQYDVYVHEDDTEKVLAPKYAGRHLRDVYSDKQYWRDVLDAGPRLGMTFVLEAARDIPVAEAQQSWADLIASRLHARGCDTDSVHGYMTALGTMLDRGRLHAESRLLNSLGTHIRQGSTLMLTTLEEGKVLVQAMTGDPVQTRDYYVLGALHSSTPLSAALTTLALGNGPDSPNQPPLDPELVPFVQTNILAAVNGYKARDPSASHPRISLPSAGVPHVALVARPKVSMFRLPAVGQGSEYQPPVVLEGLKEEVTLTRLYQVYSNAAAAADAADQALPEDTPQDVRIARRRDAAQATLAQGLTELGLPVVTLGGAGDDNSSNGGSLSAALAPALPVQPLQT